jgi:FAD/FMN-containing dehydrogenase
MQSGLRRRTTAPGRDIVTLTARLERLQRVAWVRRGHSERWLNNVEGMKQDLIALVGEGHVLDDPAITEAYARDESFVRSIKPKLVVRPGSEVEVQALVNWANQTGTALVPVSSGPPHFYGDTVPSVPGAVMVDLRRMDKILRVDRRNRMVVVEPGVTYAQLQPELAKEDMRVTPPLYPRANKSVIASLLERQPTLVTRYNYSLPEPLRNCGVIWGDGTRFFTGEAGWGPADLEGQWAAGGRQVDPKGPAQTDFYRLLTGAQGTLGIVTWASVKCELLADPRKLRFVTAGRLDDLVDLTYRLTRIRVADELFVVNSAYLATLVGVDAADIAALRDGLPAWILVIGVGGRALLPAERIAVAEKDAAEAVAAHGLRLLPAIPGLANNRVEAAVYGLYGEEDGTVTAGGDAASNGVGDGAGHWKLRYKGAAADIFFHAPLEKAPGFLGTMVNAAVAHKYPVGDVGVYLQPQHQGVAYHCEFSFPFARDDKRESDKARALFSDASRRLINEGAYFSRPYGAWAEPVYNRDAAGRDVLRTVKKILDPNNVLNPSKLCF